jgi:tetratricopeptide (TPR) repeat protein
MKQVFDTVITGAGISMANPSHLPGGPALAKYLWRQLYQLLSPQIQQICMNAEALIFPKNPLNKGLRLESICGILAKYIPFDEIKRIYTAVNSTKYNFNHAALMRLYPNEQLTLNLDTLLETAGDVYGITPSITHLHGIWSKPDTIITSISQYLTGLPQIAYYQLKEALLHKRVLVIGYSGADVDIFPQFKLYPPEYIKWIQYKDEALQPDVEEWLSSKTDCPSAVHIEKTTAQDYLYTLLKDANMMTDDLQKLYIESTATSTLSFTKPQLFASTTPTKKLLGIAAILLEVGLCQEVSTILGTINDPCVLHDRNKLLTRAFKRQNEFERAMHCLTLKQNGRFSIRMVFNNVNEFTSLLPHIQKLSRYALLCNSVIIFICRWRRQNTRTQKNEYLARIRRAKRYIFAGRLNKAERDTRFLLQNDEMTLMNILTPGSYLDAVSCYADLLKMLGEYNKAIVFLNHVEKMVAVYANVYQQAFLHYEIAKNNLLAGNDEYVAFSSLQKAFSCMPENPETGKMEGLLPIWVLTEYADLYKSEYNDIAQKALDNAKRYVNWSGDQHGGAIYYLLHLAERARVAKEYDKCVSYIEQIFDLEKNKGFLPQGNKSAKTMAFHILGMCLCSQGQDTKSTLYKKGLRYLQKAKYKYQKMGMQCGVARTIISISGYTNKFISPDQIRTYENNGWRIEAERATNPPAYLECPWVILT